MHSNYADSKNAKIISHQNDREQKIEITQSQCTNLNEKMLIAKTK